MEEIKTSGAYSLVSQPVSQTSNIAKPVNLAQSLNFLISAALLASNSAGSTFHLLSP